MIQISLLLGGRYGEAAGMSTVSVTAGDACGWANYIVISQYQDLWRVHSIDTLTDFLTRTVYVSVLYNEGWVRYVLHPLLDGLSLHPPPQLQVQNASDARVTRRTASVYVFLLLFRGQPE